MQGSLVDHRTCEKRVAVFFPCDGKSLKPVRPIRTQMALDSDLIDYGLTRNRFCFDGLQCWLAFLLLVYHASTIYPPGCRRIDTLVLVRGVVLNEEREIGKQIVTWTITNPARGRGRSLPCAFEPVVCHKFCGYAP